MLRTPNMPASCCSLSQSILASVNAPPYSPASFSRIGPSVLHGPHQVAQKSTSTGVVSEACSTSVSKLAWPASKTCGVAALCFMAAESARAESLNPIFQFPCALDLLEYISLILATINGRDWFSTELQFAICCFVPRRSVEPIPSGVIGWKLVTLRTFVVLGHFKECLLLGRCRDRLRAIHAVAVLRGTLWTDFSAARETNRENDDPRKSGRH